LQILEPQVAKSQFCFLTLCLCNMPVVPTGSLPPNCSQCVVTRRHEHAICSVHRRNYIFTCIPWGLLYYLYRPIWYTEF